MVETIASEPLLFSVCLSFYFRLMWLPRLQITIDYIHLEIYRSSCKDLVLIARRVEEIVEVLLPDPRAKHQVLGIKLAFGKCSREVACFSRVMERL